MSAASLQTNDEILNLILSLSERALENAKERPHQAQRMTQRAYDLYVAVREVATLKYGLMLPPFEQWRARP